MTLLIPPPVVALVIGLLMWGFKTAFPTFFGVFSLQLPLAVAFVSAGLAIDLVSVAQFFQTKTTVNPLKPDNTAAIVSKGLYRYSRNPMYVGQLLILTGWAVWLGHPIYIVFLMVFVWYLTVFQIKPEEAVLTEKFGEEYLAYQRTVRRWL